MRCLSSRVGLLQLGQLWRQHPHLGHRLVGRGRQGEERGFEHHRQHDDRPAPVAKEGMQPLQHPEDRRGNDSQPAVVDHQIETGSHLGQLLLFLRSGVEPHRQLVGSSRSHGGHRHNHSGGEQILGRLTQKVFPFALGWQPGRNEVVLHHGDPTVVGLTRHLGFLAGDFLEAGLLELVGVGIKGRTGKCGHHGIGAFRSLAVTGQLEVRMRCYCCSTTVGYLVLNVDQVAAALEDIGLRHLNATFAHGGQAYTQLVLTLLKRQGIGGQSPQALVVRQPGANQSALRGISMLVLEQDEVLLLVFGRLVLPQHQTVQVAAPGRDLRYVQICRRHSLGHDGGGFGFARAAGNSRNTG